MKVILPRQEFLDGLNAVASLTSGRPARPILGCARMEATADGVELSATDGEVGLRARTEALSVAEEGEVVVRAERLLAIVRELPDVEVCIEADERYCTIRGEGSEFRIFVADPADFPPIATFDGDADLTMQGSHLRRMVGLTLYAAARETSRYAINGVLLEKRGQQLFMIATDGRRLARAGGTAEHNAQGDFEVILPAKAMAVFEKVFQPGRDEDVWLVEVRVLPNQLLLRSDQRVLSTVLVEGSFPKYGDVIPQEHTRCARVERAMLLAAVRRAALLTTEESRAVQLAFGEGQLVISSQSPEQGEARVQIPIALDGEPLTIGFNPTFLGDALRALTSGEIFVELEEPFRPGVIRPENKDEFLYVVMPVSLSK